MRTWMKMGMVLAAAGFATGCGDDANGTGRLQVFVEAEDSIPGGLHAEGAEEAEHDHDHEEEAGGHEHGISDGWDVHYDTFLIAMGNFRASQSGKADASLSDSRVHVLDMKNLPAGGFVLADFADAEATRWDKVGFDIRNTNGDTLKSDTVSEEDFARMRDGGYSIYVAGHLHKAGGQQCSPTNPTDCAPTEEVAFVWGLSAGTSFDDCASTTGETGAAIPTGGTVQVKPTIHGDHWFFTNITQGAEVTDRKAQWIADADLNRDGVTTVEELRSVQASDLFTQANGYNLTGAIIPVNTAFDYVEAQARTLGDYQGDGECPTRAVIP